MNKSIFAGVALLAGAAWTAGALAGAPPGLSTSLKTSPADIKAYWTLDRMKAAKPYDVLKPSVGRPSQSSSSGQAATAGIAPQDYGLSNLPFSSSRLPAINQDQYGQLYRVVGKLFFVTWDGYNAWCSASVIGNRVIVTAAHCLMGFDGNGNPQFHNSWVFSPAYRNGSPYYTWTWSYAEVTWSWYYGTPLGRGLVPNQQDVGVIALNDQTISGAVRKVSDYTGKFGYMTNNIITADGRCNNMTVFGYPANMDSGIYQHQVNTGGACYQWYGYNNVEWGSDMGGGSSGGPLVVNFGYQASGGQINGLDPARNKVVGVVSWGYTDDGLYYKSQGSSVFNGEFLNILDHACAWSAGNC